MNQLNTDGSRIAIVTWLASGVLPVPRVPQDDQNGLIASLCDKGRYENMLVLRYKIRKNDGKISLRDGFELAARSLAVASYQEGK